MTTPVLRSIYLASRSPRRRELLAQLDIPFHLLIFRGAELAEEVRPSEAPREYVLRIASEKAQSGWTRMVQRRLPRAPVLAADTTVALDGRIFGKPADRRDAEQILSALSGKRHEVLTAVALKYEERLETTLSASEVEFRELSPQEIREYAASGECDDKAGAYAIQETADRFVVRIEGSRTNVVGLPIEAVARMLSAAGVAARARP